MLTKESRRVGARSYIGWQRREGGSGKCWDWLIKRGRLDPPFLLIIFVNGSQPSANKKACFAVQSMVNSMHERLEGKWTWCLKCPCIIMGCISIQLNKHFAFSSEMQRIRRMEPLGRAISVGGRTAWMKQVEHNIIIKTATNIAGIEMIHSGNSAQSVLELFALASWILITGDEEFLVNPDYIYNCATKQITICNKQDLPFSLALMCGAIFQ